MWILFALLGALFTSLTTILAKIGIKNVNSNFATCFRTFIVTICALLMTIITGNLKAISSLNLENYLFLTLSGIATGCSWLCYYKALQLGDVNKVAPIDKSSFILTSILFVIFFFNSTTKNGDLLTIIMLIVSIILIGTGTIIMIEPKEVKKSTNKMWLLFAILSAIFASIVSLFVKIGLKGIPSDIGTLVRTIIVFIFSLAIVLVRKDYKDSGKITCKSWIFLTLSGIATGGAWISEYYAFNMLNSNPVVVSSIGKLSILLTMLFSYFVLKEKFTKKALLGLLLLLSGIVVIIIFSL